MYNEKNYYVERNKHYQALNLEASSPKNILRLMKDALQIVITIPSFFSPFSARKIEAGKQKAIRYRVIQL